jgi:integral membrane protein
MPFGPQLSDVPRIRKALAVFKVSSVLTGTFLLLLCLMMVFRYGFFVDIELGGTSGFLGLTAKEDITGINLSTILLMVHGWFYVLYVACDFVLWRLMRWSFGRFLFVALGGIIPLLSYYFEWSVPRSVNAELAKLEATANATVDAAAEVDA